MDPVEFGSNPVAAVHELAGDHVDRRAVAAEPEEAEVEDVIGLWTGECRDAVVAKAQGREGARPFLLVEVSADWFSPGPDGGLPGAGR